MAYGDRGGTTNGYPAVPGDQVPAGGFTSYKKPARAKPAARINRTAAFRASQKAPASKNVTAHTTPSRTSKAVVGKARTVGKPVAAPAKTTTTRTPAPGRTVGAPVNTDPYGTTPTPSTPYAGTSTSDLWKLLAQQAQTENDAQAAAEAADRQRVLDFNKNVMSYLGGLPAQVGADYDKAIAQSAALGNASAQLLGAANPNAQTQADLAAIGAPSAQQQQVTNTLQNAFQGAGAVLFQQGAVLPGQAMESEKASQQAYYRGMGGVAQQHTLDLLAQLASQGAEQRASLRSGQIGRQVEAQKYQQEQDYRQAQADAEAQRYAQDFGLKRQAAAQNARVINSQLGDRRFNQRFKVSSKNADLEIQGQRLAQGKASLQLRALQSDRQWQAELERLGISKAGLGLRASELEARNRKSAKKGGFTLTQRQHLSATAADTAYDARHGITDKDGNTVQDPRTYQQAMLDMLAHGIPLTIAQRALNRYWAPGEGGPGGRPVVPYQARTRRKR